MVSNKGDIRSIVIIASNYPTSAQPQNGAFVQQIVKALALRGLNCHVIKPTSIFDRRYGKLDKRMFHSFYFASIMESRQHT